jgi:hypothetical protein
MLLLLAAMLDKVAKTTVFSIAGPKLIPNSSNHRPAKAILALISGFPLPSASRFKKPPTFG